MIKNEFELKANILFEMLRVRVDALKESEYLQKYYNDIVDAETDFDKGQKDISFTKYNNISQKLDKLEISINSGTLATRLLTLQFVYLLILLLIGSFVYKYPEYPLWKEFNNLDFQTIWFGALGGVTIAIFGIYNHIQRKDFDPYYKLWYICKPIMGGIFGWFIYLIYLLGFVTIQNGNIKTPQVAYLISFLAGFSERFTIRIIDKFMSVLTTYEKDKQNGDVKSSTRLKEVTNSPLAKGKRNENKQKRS